jgi:hypothetical protein
MVGGGVKHELRAKRREPRVFVDWLCGGKEMIKRVNEMERGCEFRAPASAKESSERADGQKVKTVQTGVGSKVDTGRACDVLMCTGNRPSFAS